MFANVFVTGRTLRIDGVLLDDTFLDELIEPSVYGRFADAVVLEIFADFACREVLVLHGLKIVQKYFFLFCRISHSITRFERIWESFPIIDG